MSEPTNTPSEGDTSMCGDCGEPCEYVEGDIGGVPVDGWWTHSIRGEDFDLADHPVAPI